MGDETALEEGGVVACEASPAGAIEQTRHQR